MPKANKKRWKVIRPPLGSGFYLPTREDLLSVKRGDAVKLIFQAGNDAPERMWVQVSKSGDSEQWSGKLDNDPAQEFTASVLKYKDIIKFHPLDVINIDSDRETSRKPSPEQVMTQSLSEALNNVNRKWYKNPNILVPAAISLIGVLVTALATMVAAYISKN